MGQNNIPPDDMRCMAYKQDGRRCTRRYVCGKYDRGRRVLCATHARIEGWPIWMWGR